MNLKLAIFLFFLAIIFYFGASQINSEQTNLYELVEKDKKADVRPVANYPEGHIIGKCDKDSTKKFAHFKSSGDFHKSKDVELILGTYNYCITGYDKDLAKMGIKAPIYDSGCIGNARHSEERQRYDVKDGITKGGLILPILINTLGAL